jgi:hypothetical protein
MFPSAVATRHLPISPPHFPQTPTRFAQRKHGLGWKDWECVEKSEKGRNPKYWRMDAMPICRSFVGGETSCNL